MRMSINYSAAIGLAILHISAIACIPYLILVGVSTAELGLQLAFYVLGGLGITALYHRSWAHNAVRFSRPVEYILASLSTLVIQMPAKQWIVGHIAHHNHTDSDLDPYSIQRGFWWAHCEWIFRGEPISDKLPTRLESNPVIHWQNRYYWPLTFTFNAAIPVAVSFALDTSLLGGLLLSSLRLTLMEHTIYSVNSVCHYWGTQPFTKDVSARNVWWFPFALGEQYHNYHHAFPRDYRHGIRAIDFDPTKWFIWSLARCGLAHDLLKIPNTRIQAAAKKARIECQ